MPPAMCHGVAVMPQRKICHVLLLAAMKFELDPGSWTPLLRITSPLTLASSQLIATDAVLRSEYDLRRARMGLYACIWNLAVCKLLY